MTFCRFTVVLEEIYPKLVFFLSSCWIDGLFFVSLLVVCSVITHAHVLVERLFEVFFRI